MNDKPDFFLSAAGEMRGDLTTPRQCWVKSRLRDSDRDDYFLIEVNPPVIGQEYGLGSSDISELILSARWQGHSLHPLSSTSCSVYISRMLDDQVKETLAITKGQLELIGWGMVFDSVDKAILHADQFRNV